MNIRGSLYCTDMNIHVIILDCKFGVLFNIMNIRGILYCTYMNIHVIILDYIIGVPFNIMNIHGILDYIAALWSSGRLLNSYPLGTGFNTPSGREFESLEKAL